MTRKQLCRLYDKAHSRMLYQLGWGGYSPYGWDWTTLWAVSPTWARTLQTIVKMWREAPE